jgi:hypothetical protein
MNTDKAQTRVHPCPSVVKKTEPRNHWPITPREEGVPGRSKVSLDLAAARWVALSQAFVLPAQAGVPGDWQRPVA